MKRTRYGLIAFILLAVAAQGVVAQGAGTDEQVRREIPSRYFAKFIGTWEAPDTLLERYPPEMAERPLVTLEWGSEGRIVRLFEAHGPGSKEDSILEGLIFWNPVTGKVEFHGYNKHSDFLFKGEYTILEEHRVQRTYDVYYPSDHRYYQSGNAVITFRETYTLSEDGQIKYNEVLYFNKRDNRWDPWSTSAMRRRDS